MKIKDNIKRISEILTKKEKLLLFKERERKMRKQVVFSFEKDTGGLSSQEIRIT